MRGDPSRSTAPDPGQVRRHAELLLDSGAGCVEVRILKADLDRNEKIVPAERYSKTIAGWFDDPERLVEQALRIRNVSAYVTPNPVSIDLLARSYNRLRPSDSTTTDAHIVGWHRWFIDFDAKRPSGISSTDAELALAIERRDRFLAENPPIREASFWGSSGNGAFVIVRLPGYANDRDHSALVARATELVIARYSDADVEVDSKVKNPARIMPLAGTMKCKGDSLPDRPHRMARIEGGYDEDDGFRRGGVGSPSFDLTSWVEAQSPIESAEPGNRPANGSESGLRRDNGRRSEKARDPDYVMERARKCVAGMRDSIEGEFGHNQLYGVAVALVDGFGLGEDQAVEILEEWNQAKALPPESSGQVLHKVRDALKKFPVPSLKLLTSPKPGPGAGGGGGRAEGGGPAGADPPGSPAVEVNTSRHEVLEATLGALAADPETYRRGPFLVRVIREKADEERLTAKSVMRGVAGSPKIIALADQVIGTRLTKFAEFFQWKKDRSGESRPVPAHPPDWLIKAIATLEYWPTIRRLMSVVECPFPRPDGSIVEEPGYDRPTSTLYLPGVDFPRVPASPTRDDARDAWGRLAHLVRQFPFDTEDDRVVYLAGMLNLVARPAIEGPVMGIAVVGNKAGTGKGLLIDAMTIPALGRPAPATTYPYDKEEAAKVKVAIALSGKPVVNFDNLEGGSTYGGGVLDSALTAHTIDDRILGASKNTGDLELRTTWFLSGNNISPAKDAYRRWMVINLVTPLESPESRDDIEDTNLRALMLAERGQIVRDALTILRAHALAGWTNGGWAPKGSFEEWDRVVRGAVWFATGRDCLATQARAAEESPDRLSKVALLEGWRELAGGRAGQGGVTAAEALARVAKSPEDYPGFHATLMEKGQRGHLPTSSGLGSVLRGLKNTLVGGYRLKQVGLRHNAACWAVECVNSAATSGGECGECGECGSIPPTRKNKFDNYIITNGCECKSCRGGVEPHSPPADDAWPEGRE